MGRAEGTNPRAQRTNLRAVRGDPTPAQRQSKGVVETRERHFEAVAWAERNVPDEYAPFAASAANSLRHRLKGWPSAEQVRARLIEQGRSMSQLESS